MTTSDRVPMTADDLVEWMDSRGIGVRKLAKMLDVHPTTVSKWRRGQRTISVRTTLAIRSLDA